MTVSDRPIKAWAVSKVNSTKVNRLYPALRVEYQYSVDHPTIHSAPGYHRDDEDLTATNERNIVTTSRRRDPKGVFTALVRPVGGHSRNGSTFGRRSQSARPPWTWSLALPRRVAKMVRKVCPS
jgi:hypothetical protein